jgi:propionate CoA-transferase
VKPIPFGPRTIVARRAAMELIPGAMCNLGAGISAIAAEEGIIDRISLGSQVTGRATATFLLLLLL